MLHIREVKTKVGSRSIQVIRYSNGRRIIVKHIGTGRTESELAALKELATAFIEDLTHQGNLFDAPKHLNDVVLLSQCKYLGFYYTYLYDALDLVLKQMGYTLVADRMLLDLVIMRIVEPSSKLRSLELMETYFGVKHRRQRFYESAKKWLLLKDTVEIKTLDFARRHYHCDFSLMFYDVTTLYFETFESDELRKPGFSKDTKSQQPQILVALLVTQDGFPISFEVFSGNTFEGHTMLPVIKSFIKKHQIKHLSVVADAAMISTANVNALKEAQVNYIVGARLANLSTQLLKEVEEKLTREDGYSIRLNTPNGDIICSFSTKRYKKDKYELEKQIDKAKKLLTQPSKISKIKFIKTQDDAALLNEDLIEKSKKLLGIKGYYTDIEASKADNNLIIERYHDLFKIEQAFRLAKSDLQTRPIFHFKEEPIRLHILVNFMALAIAKHIELTSKLSIRAFVTNAKKITDARLLNTITKKELRLRADVPVGLHQILIKLARPH
jgi:transposase